MALVIVVALALVAWFVVLPMVRDANEPPEEEPRVLGHLSRTPIYNPRVPDILTMPTGWSKVVKVKEPFDWNNSVVIDTGIEDIVLLAQMESLQAVDLSVPRVLWTTALYRYRATLGNGLGVISDKNYDNLSFVDLRTGQLRAITQFSHDDHIEYVGDNGVLTTDSGTNQLCVRRYENISQCEWRAKVGPEDGNAPLVFGGGQWVNTGEGVYDLVTGEKAPFGADSGHESVFYAGSRDTVIRVVDNGSSSIIQPWNTLTDLALSDPVTLQGYLLGFSTYWFDGEDWPWILVESFADHSAANISAYSWRTGQQLWESQLSLGKDTMSCYILQTFDAVIGISMDTVKSEESLDCHAPDEAVVSSQTGQVLMHRDYINIAGASPQVAYLSFPASGSTRHVLHAYDMGSSSFDELWKFDGPGKGWFHYVTVANHIMAWSMDKGQLWVLEP